jgi:hypothetical protein
MDEQRLENMIECETCKLRHQCANYTYLGKHIYLGGANCFKSREETEPEGENMGDYKLDEEERDKIKKSLCDTKCMWRRRAQMEVDKHPEDNDTWARMLEAVCDQCELHEL